MGTLRRKSSIQLKEKNNNEQIYNNYVVENKRNDFNYLNNFYKDPDVWTSPEEDPRFSYDKKYKAPPLGRLVKKI